MNASSMEWNVLLNASRIRPSSRLKTEVRSEFDRDYDRALFSTPVRRLQDKAQVFPLEPNDSVRTRLTHSNEVAAISRTLAYQVGTWLNSQGKISVTSVRDLEFIAMTCGLLHDIGNPPFGHSGEKAISGWFKKKFQPNYRAFVEGGQKPESSQKVCDFMRFEGNAQTIRIVTKLQLLTDFSGLNLTYGTLSAAFKYIASSQNTNSNDAARKKTGYFWSEGDIYNDVAEKTGTAGRRNPITFLVEAADDIAYGVVDIEDGIKKSVVTWEQILADSAISGVLKPIIDDAKVRVDKAKLTGQERENAIAVWFRTLAIGKLVPSMVRAFQSNYEEIMAGSCAKPLEKLCDEAELISACKAVGFKYIYFCKDILCLEVAGRKVIENLMDLFWEGATEAKTGSNVSPREFPDKIYQLMSANYRRVYESELSPAEGPNDYRIMQLVTDYVCGMTDSFAIELHRRLVGG